MEYTCTMSKTEISYLLSHYELRAREGDGLAYALPLCSGIVTMKCRRVYSRFFYAGIAAFITPLIAFGPIILKKGFSGLADLNLLIGVHALLFVLGIFLLHRFRRPMMCFQFLHGESGICVWRDNAAPDKFDSFINAVKQVIARG